jgi:hypothetical protein
VRIFQVKKSKFTPPEPTAEDTAHLVTKAMLSPIWGASELFERLVSSPLDRRTREWMANVADFLQQNFGYDLEKLESNEKFLTVFVQATRIAAQNHQKEKLNALRNAIVSSVFHQDISEDLQLIFIRFIDELTPSHLLLLKFFVKFESELAKLKSYPALFDFFHAHYEYSNALYRDEFKMLIGDLNTRGLVRVSQDIEDFEDIYEASSILLSETNDSLPRILITQIAKDFIRFISDNTFAKIRQIE